VVRYRYRERIEVSEESLSDGSAFRRTRIHRTVMEVAVMSITPREQQALERIEAGLTGADPKLAAMLATFTRLTSDEKMPAGEQVRTVSRPGVRTRQGRGRASAHPWLPTTAVLLIVTVLIAVTAALAGGADSGACARSWALTCASTVPPNPLIKRADITRTGAW
jgi:hypothetical protein